MRRIILFFGFAMTLLALSSAMVTATTNVQAEPDYKNFYCNCDSRPFELERQKLNNKEYTREEIEQWGAHKLAHTRNTGRISVPIVFGEEEGIALGELLRTVVGDRGIVECDISHVKTSIGYSYSIAVSEDLIADVFVDVLAAGIYCDCGTYHLIPKPFSKGDLDMNSKVDSKDYMMLKRVVLGSYTADDNQVLLADVNGDGKIGAQDYMMVKRHVLGTYEIIDGVLIDFNA